MIEIIYGKVGQVSGKFTPTTQRINLNDKRGPPCLKKLQGPNSQLTCSAKLCVKNGQFLGSYRIHILVFLTLLLIFVSLLEKYYLLIIISIMCIEVPYKLAR